MKPFKVAIYLCGFLFLPSLASADTITLKNGTQYKGAVLKESRDEVEAMIDVGIIRFRRSDVADIKKGSIWENNFYLKKAEGYPKEEGKTSAAKTKAAPAPAAAKAKPAAAPAADSDVAFRERELELRKQEMEIRRMELELQKEELKLKKEALEAGKQEKPGVEGAAPVVIEKGKKGTAEIIEKKEIIEKEEVLPEEEGVGTGEAVPGKKPLSEEEIRQITIEEQLKEQARKEKLESERRLQEIRQNEEGVTIRGKVAPASGEKYNTY